MNPLILSLIHIQFLLRHSPYFANIPPPPSLLIMPTYLLHDGPGCCTAATGHIWYMWGWVITLNPRAHTHYRCDLRPVFLSFWRGLRYHGPDCCCGNECIYHCLPTGRPFHDFHIRPAGETTRYVTSKSYDPHRRRFSTSTCEHPYHIQLWSVQLIGCNLLWPVLIGLRDIWIESGWTFLLSGIGCRYPSHRYPWIIPGPPDMGVENLSKFFHDTELTCSSVKRDKNRHLLGFVPHTYLCLFENYRGIFTSFINTLLY